MALSCDCHRTGRGESSGCGIIQLGHIAARDQNFPAGQQGGGVTCVGTHHTASDGKSAVCWIKNLSSRNRQVTWGRQKAGVISTCYENFSVGQECGCVAIA